MIDKTIRPLVFVVAAQLLLVALLLFWAAIGFPLPGFITGPGEAATTSQTTAAREPAPAPAPAAGAGAGTGAQGDQVAQAALAPRPRTNHFDSRRAFALLREQVEQYGWRPAGSPALQRLAARLRTLLPAGRYEAIPGHPGLRNIVGSIPGRGKAIVVGAHYDVEAEPEGFVGANDGAAGTAAVVWLARSLARAKRSSRDRPLRFVLFDGEEEPRGCTQFEACALRGSKAYAARHGGQTRTMVLLDYIAEKNGLRFPREATSDRRLWAKLRSAARHAGVTSLFPDELGGGVIDDHTPFLDRDIPAIDIIDFDYPSRDSLADTLDKVSERSLDAVGETVHRLVTVLRRER
jgi:glutaminyl-peptide cyclotransferase